MATAPRIIVIGGGLAGLASVIEIAAAGGTVDLFSIVPVKSLQPARYERCRQNSLLFSPSAIYYLR